MDKILEEWKEYLRSINNIKKDRVDTIAEYAKQDSIIRSAAFSPTGDVHQSLEVNSTDLMMAIQVLNEINNFEKIKIVNTPVVVDSNTTQINLQIMEVSDDNYRSFLIRELIDLFNNNNILNIYVYQLFSHRIFNNYRESIEASFTSRYKLEYLSDDKNLKLFINQGL